MPPPRTHAPASASFSLTARTHGLSSTYSAPRRTLTGALDWISGSQHFRTMEPRAPHYVHVSVVF